MKVKYRLDKDRPTEVVWVRSKNRPKTYRVQLHRDGRMSCTCPHGLNNADDTHCYHSDAALAVFEKLLGMAQRLSDWADWTGLEEVENRFRQLGMEVGSGEIAVLRASMQAQAAHRRKAVPEVRPSFKLSPAADSGRLAGTQDETLAPVIDLGARRRRRT